MGGLDDVLRNERWALIDLLETLSPEEWATPSLCEAWTVQEVAGHLAAASSTPLPSVLAAMVRGGFRVNAVNVETARAMARRGPDEVIGRLRRIAETGDRPPGMPLAAALVDATVHQLDIARPLDRPRPTPEDAFVPAARFSLAARWPLTLSVGGSARHRVRGLRLVAEGADWSHGEGPEVRGSTNSLLLLLNGRAVRDDELSGEGADLLRSRL